MSSGTKINRAYWKDSPDHLKALVEGMIRQLEANLNLDASTIRAGNQVLAARYSNSQVTTKMHSLSAEYPTAEALRGYLATLSSPRTSPLDSKKRLQNAKIRAADKVMVNLNRFGIKLSDGDDADYSPLESANDEDYETMTDEVREAFDFGFEKKKKLGLPEMRSIATPSPIVAPVLTSQPLAAPSPYYEEPRDTGNVVPEIRISWYRAFNKVYCIVKNIPCGAEITRKLDVTNMRVVLHIKWVDNVDVKSWLSRQAPNVQVPTIHQQATIPIAFPADAVAGTPTVIQGAPDGLFGLEFLSRSVAQAEAPMLDF